MYPSVHCNTIYNSQLSLIHRYFMLFDAAVNGIFPLISLFDISLLVYKNGTDFYVLILHLATLSNSLMSSSSFLVVALGFFMCRIMSSTNSDSFTFSFPVWIPFISFSSLIVVDKTSKTMFNKSDQSRHPCLVPDPRRNAFSFSPLSMMLVVDFSNMAFIILRYIPSVPTFWRCFIILNVLSYCCWILWKAFSVPVEMVLIL